MKYVALIRGINVGGVSLSMAELVDAMQHLGAEEVKTYIQSGNAVFKSDDLDLNDFAIALSEEIKRRRGRGPHVIIKTQKEWEEAMAANPFPDGEAEPKTLHLGFLDREAPNPDLQRLSGLKKDSERFELKGKVFYLHAPEGIGRSKMAVAIEKALGVPTTDRNWRTVCKIREMLDS